MLDYHLNDEGGQVNGVGGPYSPNNTGMYERLMGLYYTDDYYKGRIDDCGGSVHYNL